MKDLFYDSDQTPRRRRQPQSPKPWKFVWRRTATALLNHAEGLCVRATDTLAAAKGLNIATWTDEELNTALIAVSRAFADFERAELLEDVAFAVRWRHLTNEEGRGTRDTRAA